MQENNDNNSKMAKDYQKMAKNDNDSLKIYYKLTLKTDGNLTSMQHTWYLPKNGQKRAKNGKNRQTAKFAHREMSCEFF